MALYRTKAWQTNSAVGTEIYSNNSNHNNNSNKYNSNNNSNNSNNTNSNSNYSNNYTNHKGSERPSTSQSPSHDGTTSTQQATLAGQGFVDFMKRPLNS